MLTLPTTNFAYWKALCTYDALLCVSNILSYVLNSGQEARILQIDFSAASDIIRHQRILLKLWSKGIGGSVLSVLTQFLSNRSQHIIADGCRSNLVSVVSGVPQGDVLCPLLFLLYNYELCTILKNSLIAVVPSLALELQFQSLSSTAITYQISAIFFFSTQHLETYDICQMLFHALK